MTDLSTARAIELELAFFRVGGNEISVKTSAKPWAIWRVAFIVGGAVVVMGLAAILVIWPRLPIAVWAWLIYPTKSIVTTSGYRNLIPIAGVTANREYDCKPGTSVNSDAVRDLRRFAEKTQSNVVIVKADGAVAFESYLASPGANCSSLTNGMSMTKSLIGLLVGIAIDRQKIESVEEKVKDFIPEWQGDARGEITIRDLLEMNSGLEGQNENFPLSHLQWMYFGDRPEEHALTVPLERVPGKHHQYNGVDAEILTLIVERVFKGRLETLLSDLLWKPLELDTAFTWKVTARGESKGFCCVFADALSWARLGRLFLNGGKYKQRKIVSRKWIDEMIAPSRLNPDHYGYQIRRRTLTTKSGQKVDIAYFSGAAGQRVYILPYLGVVATRVGEDNSQLDFQEFLDLVEKAFSTKSDRE